MFKTIFGLAFQGLWRRRKQTLVIVSVLTISLLVAVLVISYSGSITATNEAYRYTIYGSWYGSIPSTQDGDYEFLSSQDWLDSLGTSTNYGTVSDYGIGTVDENLADMGITLLDGRLPESSGEIAVEEALLSALGYDPVVGQTISMNVVLHRDEIKGNNISIVKTFTVTGIISNYSNLWLTSTLCTLNSAIITEEDAQSLYAQAEQFASRRNISLSNPSVSYYFTVKDGCEDIMKESVNAYLRETRNSTLASENSVLTNTLAYSHNASEASYNSFYIALIFAVSLLAVIVIYTLQFQPEVQRIVRFRSLGATKGQVRTLIFTETMLCCVPSLVLGTALGAIGIVILLKLSVYTGSVSIVVNIPWSALLPAVFVWILGILAIRAVTIQIALATPLTGKMGMTAKRRRLSQRFQKILIFAMSASLCIAVLFTSLNSLSAIYYYNTWNNNYDYSIKDMSLNNEGISDSDIETLSSVFGIDDILGKTILYANVSTETGDNISATLYVIDGTADWSHAFNFSKVDVEDFEDGNSVIVTFASKSDENVAGLSDKVTVSYQNISVSANIASTQITDIMDYLDYGMPAVYSGGCGIVCSRAFLQKMVDSLSENATISTSQNSYKSGDEVLNFESAVGFASSSTADASTDKTLISKASKLALSVVDNNRAANDSRAQDYLQTIIMLYVSGICISVIVLIILFSTIKLETQREKKRYGILQALGMSRRQRNRELLRTAFVRSVVAVAVGWGAYLGSVIIRNLDSIREEGATVLSVLSSYMSDLTTRFIPSWAMILMTAAMFVAVLLICYVSKLGLNKYSLMEMLREDR
ncbi:MAG: ABC transporter permease [Oscillospiraceae bacterium]|nr:ABC transporter permease [Oscillospiraceae bacterium]